MFPSSERHTQVENIKNVIVCEPIFPAIKRENVLKLAFTVTFL